MSVFSHDGASSDLAALRATLTPPLVLGEALARPFEAIESWEWSSSPVAVSVVRSVKGKNPMASV